MPITRPHHDVDPVCERSYRQILGELIPLDEQEARRLPDVLGLRSLFRGQSWRDVLTVRKSVDQSRKNGWPRITRVIRLKRRFPILTTLRLHREFQRVLSEFSAHRGRSITNSETP